MESEDRPLDRAIAVMQAVCDADRALSITEIAHQCALPVPSVHRLVAQLEPRALLKRQAGSKKLLVGAALVRLGAAALRASVQSDQVQGLLQALAAELNEHCQLASRVGHELVYANTVRAARSTGLHFEQGRRAPLYCTSIGKLYLAEMGDEELDAWLKTHPRVALTPQTMLGERALKAAVKRVRESGWAKSNQELAVGVIGCAVPVRFSDGRLVAGLGISVPSPRLRFEDLEKFRPAMERTAVAIAEAMEGA